MEREVRYCTTSDGVRIAYCVEGEGPPLVVLPWNVTSFSLTHLVPAMDQLLFELVRGRQLIQADIRGIGLSQRDVTNISFESLLDDIESVIDTLGLSRFSVFAMTNASPYAIAYAARHPERVERIVFYAAFARPVPEATIPQARAFAEFARTNWELASRAIADVEIRRKSEEIGLRIAQWFQQSVAGETAARLFEVNIDVDATEFLPHVKCPALVIQRRDDSRYEDGRELAAALPDARFITIEGKGGLAVGDWQPIIQAIGDFLPQAEGVTPIIRTADSAFRTVLFTDVVENTALLRRIGDEGWRAVMREHDEIVRAALREHGGTEISTSGDGFFASFGSSVKAIQCAVEMQRALARRNETAEHPVEVRIGLNAGEPIEEGKDVLGTAVTMAARIMSQAGGGEILVSDVLRQLVAGKGFLFADRGEFVAKGFEEPVRIYEVRWRE